MKTIFTLFCVIVLSSPYLSAQWNSNQNPISHPADKQTDPYKVSSVKWQSAGKEFESENIINLTTVGSTVYATTTLGFTYRSKDCGNTWILLPYFDSFYSLVAGLTGKIIGTAPRGLAISTDEGMSWKSISDKLPLETIIGCNVLGSTIVTFMRDKNYYCTLYSTTDEGNTWGKKTGFTPMKGIIGISAVDTTLFVYHTYASSPGETNPRIAYSTNYGVGWSIAVNSLPGEYTWINSFAVIKDNIFISSNRREAYRFTKSYSGWGGQKKIVFEDSVQDIRKIIEMNNRMFMQTINGVYYSSDKGMLWKHVGNDGLPNPNLLSMTSCGSKLFVGTSAATGLWTIDITDLPLVSSVDEDFENMNTKSQFNCYPNPTTNSLTIDRTSLQFPENTPVHYTLSTLIGGKVMEFDNNEPKFTVSIEGMASGVYSLIAVSGANRAAVMVTVVE